MTGNIPTAMVVSWDYRTFRAKCPYCLKTHGHGFATDKTRTEQGCRRSDCRDPSGDYRVKFPDQATAFGPEYGWEFDRRWRSFLTVSSQGRQYDAALPQPFRTLLLHHARVSGQVLPEDETNEREHNEAQEMSQLAGEIEDLRLGAADGSPQLSPTPVTPSVDEIWDTLMASASHRRRLYISACMNRDLPMLRGLMQAYPEDDFPSLTDEHSGGNGVLHAATEENAVETIKFLLENGAAPDQPDRYGRTALMEAALWGRYESVLLLTNTQQVNLHARDANKLSALDLSMASERNRGERSERAGDVYREPNGADINRQRIEHHIRSLVPNEQRVGQDRTPDSFFQRQPDGTMAVYRPVLEMAIPRGGATKAFAELNRGAAYPLVQAMSGYSHSGWTNVLNNDVWTERANQLRTFLGMEASHSYASHVEPQLLAYILFYHSLLDIEDSSEWNLDLPWKEVEWMREAAPEYGLDPVITVNKEGFCPQCQTMKNLMSERCPWLNNATSTSSPFNESPPTPRSLPNIRQSQPFSAATKRKRRVDECVSISAHETCRKRFKAGRVESTQHHNLSATSGAETQDPLECWARTGAWPNNFGKMRSSASDGSNKRRRSSTPSYSSREKDGSVPPAHTAAYEEELQRHGIMFDDIATKDFVAVESKNMCEDLLNVRGLAPAYNSCSEETYIKVFQRATKRNEERVRRDLTPHIVPSAELLHLRDGESELENIREELSVDWTKCSLMGGTQPRPDGAFGLSSQSFSEVERAKMDNYTNIDNPTKFTESLYFPFLLHEAKCDKKNVSEADRQNIHSASIAVRAIVRLCRASGEDHAQQLNGWILVFSISHDHERVKIYGHFPLIRDGRTTFHRYNVHNYNLNEHYGRERNTGSNFTRALYRDFYPRHLERIRQAIAGLPDPRTISMTSNISVGDSEEGSQQSSQDLDSSSRPSLRRTKSQGSQKELALMKQTMAKVEKMYQEQLEQQQKQMEQMQKYMEQQMEQQKEDSRKQMEQQREDSQKQIAMLERLLKGT
ncbi:hypothetical protein LTR62_002351 [Meristemomyces frigidus]|uniref:DUF7924 domain-containing protein n=1 Tax=Meristemomyces frigidus TaxID=1508187 RepID=A0AAN7T8F1_9PEZI|nr:hypothetical protein LTR62_002351 [Meristemomyces frigidus]